MGLFATLGINDIHHNNTAIMLSAVMLGVVMLNVVRLSVVMLNVVRLSVVMLSALTRFTLFTIPQSCWTFESDETNQQILTIHSRARLRGQHCKKIYTCNLRL
jgi:hypothetical protein